MSGVSETWWDAGGIFACPDTDSFSARCQNREEHSPLATRTAAFMHALVLLVAGLALCYGESINLTRRPRNAPPRTSNFTATASPPEQRHEALGLRPVLFGLVDYYSKDF
jgi:hypothetical protein